MEWINLLLATFFEIGWPLGFKLASLSNHRVLWLIMAAISMILSGIFLYYAQKHIPIGIAYAIWTGLGAACTFLIGVFVFNDMLNLMRILGVLMIIFGVVLLKIG